MPKKRSASEILADARDHHYAVAAMNANGATYDITRAILEAADAEESPIIIQAYDHNIVYRGYAYFVELVDQLARGIRVPYAIGLDHGSSVASAMKAVKAGFTGVMLDTSDACLHETISLTSEIATYLKPVDVSLEIEIGHMARQEELDKGNQETDPDDVKTFLDQVDVDLLAVSVGTSHGIHELQDSVNLELIRELAEISNIPLVMHGTSGVPLNLITEAVRAGMRKINFGEAFRANFIRYFREVSETLDHHQHAWMILREVKDRLREDMREIIRAVNAGCS